MDIKDYRKAIDRIDEQLLQLISERMNVAAAIAEYKKENNLPVLDSGREREKIRAVLENTPEELKDYTPRLFSLLFEVSRSYQNRIIGVDDKAAEK